MKLLILTEGYPWGENVSGIFHRDQFQQFSDAGIDIRVVAPTPWVPPIDALRRRWRNYAMAPRVQAENGLIVLRPRYFTVPRETAWIPSDLTRYLAVRRMNLPRPDIIQSYFAVPTGEAARRLARHWNVPHVVGMLGDDVNIYPQRNARNLRMLKRVVGESSFAFANGPTLAKKVTLLTGRDVPALSIGVLAERFENLPDRESARRILGWPMDRKIALYVGAMTATKGIGELIATATQLQHKGITTVAIGEGPLRRKLSQIPETICGGSRPATDVALAMRAADVLAHPSHYEGLPTVLVEAGFARLPIVTTIAPGCIDLARDGRALMVPVGDADALGAAIVTAVQDQEASRGRADLMLAHVREHYNLKANARRLMDLYQRLVAEGLP